MTKEWVYPNLTNDESDKLAFELKNLNDEFFYLLYSLILDDDDKFKLERINLEISTNAKVDVDLRISMAVRKYAKRMKNVPKSSVWKSLMNNENHFSFGSHISREAILTLGFVFRLNSQEIDSLLLAADYNRLYTRSAIECAYIYTCELYRNSPEYERFCDESAAVNDEEFICNFTFFNQIASHEARLAPSESAYINNIRAALIPNGKKLPRTITRSNLEKFILEEALSAPNQTAEFTEALRGVIKTSRFGNESSFYFFLNTHRDKVFVPNRERSLRYVYNCLYRYMKTPRFQSNESRELEDQISLAYFYKRFSMFLDGLNLFTPAEIFIRYYFECDGDDGAIIPDTDTYYRDYYSEDHFVSVQEAKLGLIRTTKELLASDSKSTTDTNGLSEDEKQQIKEILTKDGEADSQLKCFKKVLVGDYDVSKLLLVLMYLFTSVGDRSEGFRFSLDTKETALNSFFRSNLRFCGDDEGSIEELNAWLEDSGFSTMIGDPLRDFVESFLNNAFKEEIIDFDSEGTPEHFEEVKGRATNNYLTPVLLKNLNITMFKNLHKNIKSLYNQISTLLI